MTLHVFAGYVFNLSVYATTLFLILFTVVLPSWYMRWKGVCGCGLGGIVGHPLTRLLGSTQTVRKLRV